MAHVLACQDEGVVWVIYNSMESMDKWMVKMATALEVREAMKQALLSWKQGGRPPIPASDQPGFVEVFHSQECIGG